MNIQLQKHLKQRNPNVDLIRIIGMISIVIHHILMHGKVIAKYKYKQLYLLNILCHWHVSSFGLVSGIVGYKTNKFSNLFYLWFSTLIYSLFFHIIYNKQKAFNLNTSFCSNLMPVTHYKYWYFSAYFGVYPFLFFINIGIASIPQKEFKKCIIFMFWIFIVLTSYYIDVFGLKQGYNFYLVFLPL